MRIGVIGVNCHTCDLALREKITQALTSIAYDGTVLLSTCNRCELYFACDDPASMHTWVMHALRTALDTPFEETLYTYFERDCFIHLGRVTAGLDSAIVSESEIQRQVKLAYEKAAHHSLNSALHYLFQKCLRVGKRIRTQFPETKGMPGLDSIAYSLFQERSQGGEILFVGNSEINRKLIHAFRMRGVSGMTLCTRSLKAGEKLGLASRNSLALNHWQQYETIICGTDQPGYQIKKENFSRELVCKTRLILDLSLPRGVDPSVGKCPDILLKNIEELGTFVSRKRRHKIEALKACEALVRESIDRYITRIVCA